MKDVFIDLCLTIPQQDLLTELIRCEIEELQGSKKKYIAQRMHTLVEIWISLVTKDRFLILLYEQEVLENLVRQEIKEVGRHFHDLEYVLEDATPEEKHDIGELLNEWCAILEAVRPVKADCQPS